MLKSRRKRSLRQRAADSTSSTSSSSSNRSDLSRRMNKNRKCLSTTTTTRRRRTTTTLAMFLFGILLFLAHTTHSANALQESNIYNEKEKEEENDDDDDDFVCNVYVAPSTIPGTGLGMYAGAKGYKEGEVITKSLGDHIIPIPDVKTAQGDTGLYDRSSDDMAKYFLWDQYTWTNAAFGIHFLYLAAHEVEVASPGFGAAANSFMDFVNVEEGGCEQGLLPYNKNDDNDNDNDNDNYSRVHRSRDPGAGAFTNFHSRKAWASREIAPNSEFFVAYGNEWFLDRVWRLGTIPVEGDHEEAEWLWKIFSKEFLGKQNVTFGYDANDPNVRAELRQGRRNYNDENEGFQENVRRVIRETQPPAVVTKELKEIHQDFWDDVVATFFKNTWDDSRIMVSLPIRDNWDEYESMLTTEGGYKQVKRQKMVRSPEWLQEHGICADSVRIGRSTLHQAGHGAFSRTTFAEGEVVMAAPLIHIPDRAILDTFYILDKDQEQNNEEEELNEELMDEMGFKEYNHEFMTHLSPEIGYWKTGEQLLLNYVFGHRDSTMALSPYGPGVNLINHNQTLVNVKLQWAEPHRSNHHPELLKESIPFIHKKFPMGSVLGMEIVATRPIAKGEELFLDYGDEWEQAWQKHVAEWKPQPGSEDYASSSDLNKLPEYLNKPLDDWFGKKNKPSPHPSNVRLLMSAAWVDEIRDQEGDDAITEEIMYKEYDYLPVTTCFRTGIVGNPYKYMVEDERLFSKLLPKQKEHILQKYNEIVESEDYDASAADTSEDPTVYDNSLYTVVVRREVQYTDEEREAFRRAGRKLPTYEVLTAKDIPRRGLTFEDRSYTMDQFLENAFREYIRIPDELFPEAWKNLATQEQKDDHYYRYREVRPGHPDRKPWYELLEEEEKEAFIEEAAAETQHKKEYMDEETEEMEMLSSPSPPPPPRAATMSMWDVIQDEEEEDGFAEEDYNDDDEFYEEEEEEFVDGEYHDEF